MTAEAQVGAVLVGAAALYLTVRWAARERRSPAAPNYPKWLYLGSTAALFGLAFVDPVAAIVGFVSSHSVEYFVLVNRSVASEARQVGPLSRIARCAHGRLLFFAFYGLVVVATFLLLYRVVPASFLLVAVLVIGATHFFYRRVHMEAPQPERRGVTGRSAARVRRRPGDAARLALREAPSPCHRGLYNARKK